MTKNTLRKSLLLMASVFSISLIASAQEEFHYNFGNGVGSGTGYTGVQASLNAILNLPLNDAFRQRISSGIGASAQLKYLIDSKFSFGAYGAYNLLAARTPVAGQTNTLLQYGVMAEYFLFKGSSPYFGIDLGNYAFSLNVSGSSYGGSNVSYSRSSLGIGPNIGYLVQLNPNMFLNTNLKYNHVFNTIVSGYDVPTQFLQLSVGLIFNLSYRPVPSNE